MVKKKRHTSKKPLILTCAAIVIVIAVAIGYLYESHRPSGSSKAVSQNLTSAKAPYHTINYGQSIPNANADNNSRKSNPSSAATTLDNGPTANTSNSNAYVTVNRASVSGSYLAITASVYGNVTSGTCVANVSQPGQKTITSSPSVNIEQQNNTYVCQNIEIPLSEFPNKGNWYVSVSVTYNNSTITAEWDNNAAVSLSS